MFLEGPSTRSLIEGFMVKTNRKFEDFQSLIGFNIRDLSYELIQATALLYYEYQESKAPCEIGQMTINQDNIYIKYIDNNIAIIHIDFFNNGSINIKFNYRTDNFPGFNIIYFNGSYVSMADVRSISSDNVIPTNAILNTISDINIYIPHLLWHIYKKKMSDKK